MNTIFKDFAKEVTINITSLTKLLLEIITSQQR